MDYEGSTKKRKRSPSAGTAGNASYASAFSSASGGEYEVFLSFRGKDTRKGFTDYLYTDLVHEGIRTFREDEELRVGEEIFPELLKVIRESKIFIPIFSRDYAYSQWCLRELAQMVECQKTMGQKILPIFYDVEPSDVRHQTGSYKEAFRQHKKRFDEKTIQGWKEALRKVGELKGWELKKETNGYQGELVKMVVSKVLFELRKNYPVVTDNLVGLDHHVEEMMGLLNVDSNDVRIVGIHGMGGIGKTTLAKVIYNQLSEGFECCCFLANVRETSQQPKGLVNLQNQHISMILKMKCLDIADVDEGINMIKYMVCRKKVFIVFDDVDEKFQFDKLVGKRDWFGSGSRIILTTRNKEVLNVLEVDGTYEPPLMGPDHSLQLFSKHAFRRDFPPEDYDILSRKVVSTAAGLPLALEILGFFLFDKGKAEWEDTLMKLKKMPDEKVQKKLRISYEALNYEQKQIFLDIACLFIGEDKRIAFYMWDDCKFYPTNGIDVLVLRSLVKIGDDNRLWMHDQLRDLGREIVCEENFKEPLERSRLWCYEEALDLLEGRKGTEKVEALSLDLELESHGHHFTNEQFRQLPNLRFLRVDHADLAGDFKHLLSKLRWLHWRRCPGNFTPTNFHLKNLVILDLSYSFITHDWEVWSQIKMAKKLKVLDLSHCDGLIRTPDFSTFTTLEILILKWCRNLVQIDPSIGKIINLRELVIADSGIKTLPDSIGKLEKLEEINASGCFNLQGEIPSNIGKLSFMRILRLDATLICSLPTSVCWLSCLQTLCLFNCRQLQSLPELPPSLTSLHVTCTLMETFPSLSNLMNLKELSFDDCLNLVEIPKDIGKLSKLETLTLCIASISTLPAEIGALSQLKQLKVRFCKNLQYILGLPSSLFKLCLDFCESVERLPNLSNLKNLSELMLVGCSELIEIEGLGKLELLTSLDVSMCEKLAKLDGLEQLESLRYLNTSCCKSLERLPDLSNLKKLRKLVTKGCKKLIEIQGLERLESLEDLNMDGCISIERLPDLSNLGMLKELTLRECQKLIEVEGSRTASAGTARNTLASLNTSSASASASTSGGEYEVFLSFRGNDTRSGFTDYLYNDLVDAGIRTFKCNNEHHVGGEIDQELHKVIKESKISIPIFSRNYASCKWCLLELTHMVKCLRTMGQKILPIFYDVEPSDVQHQTGRYRKAFHQHKKHFDEKTIQGWKEALRVVGQMKGWELKKETNGHQGKLVKMVVSKVLLELKKNYMVVTDNLVGIDHHVEEMIRLLNVDSNDVLIVGIHGKGGIGKTTIAKVMYNKLAERFECCSFLANVRETSQQHKGLVNLQNQLISKILKGKCLDIVDVDEGINMIKDTVCKKKVLIVLDDVDKAFQFDKLAGKRDWFGSGSRIIVTTRNKDVLNVLEVDRTYEPPLMEPDHSLQLFSNHAFRRNFPPEDYDNLSRKVVSIVAGLPLALEIIGLFLFGKGKAVWEETLMKLGEVPDDQDENKLAYLENLDTKTDLNEN